MTHEHARYMFKNVSAALILVSFRFRIRAARIAAEVMRKKNRALLAWRARGIFVGCDWMVRSARCFVLGHELAIVLDVLVHDLRRVILRPYRAA